MMRVVVCRSKSPPRGACIAPSELCFPPPLQWVFYLFGASAVVWIPFWLPLPVAQALPGGDIKAGKPLQDVGRWSRQASAVGLETIEENQVRGSIAMHRCSIAWEGGGPAEGGGW